jgi:DNA-directed RNA polymerase specialized sigma24 family protein
VLQALMGYSTDEIASHLGLTRSAVLSRLHRAKQKLRVALGAPEIEAQSSTKGFLKARNGHSCAA